MSRRGKWSVAGIEPRLDDVLADPLVRTVMRRDGVTSEELRGILEALRAQRAETDAEGNRGDESSD
ncbi:MAG: hypothetical protein OEU09_12800 [Rhodospirillales bacterium]|nr:hypothetical protein [Rhodospirillales bacterium]MDH3792071.1 hypothetical protein [Rhodospirillales bacterium]MDH3912166.1 hypothetical protein [Rhodospirillales bacterium]MDH3918868.1 hypothetical protein [Rhodospirillales bacterium]MDH3967209.1 hypothetical protein [Rhodospirillales bacterium]